jgi:dTDP-L-rhamnose 4-epimerase
MAMKEDKVYAHIWSEDKEFRLGDIRHNKADLSKITTLLGFVPKVSFSEGIVRFADWGSRQVIMNESYDASILELRKKRFLK